MNYYDILLAKKLEDDRDPKVEGLSVTANGTYSEEGKVYNPVVVNVAGYGLADMPGGAIASFSDGAALPLNKLKVSIDPVQSGSGNPSPTNIRPISGHTEAKITDCGKNMFYMTNDNKFMGYLDNTKIVANSGHTCYYFPCKGNVTYTVSKIATATNGRLGIAYSYEVPTNNLPIYGAQILNSFVVGQRYSITTTTDASAKYIIVWAFWGADGDSKDSIQLEFGSEPTTFTPYDTNSHTTSIQFVDGSNPLTVYGGTLDVVSGELVVTDGYIESYNGETLPSTWISDRDVYTGGTTPTIGAEVCYKLATPQTILQLTPTSIKSIEGVNNIFADTGNILEGQYFKSL